MKRVSMTLHGLQISALSCALVPLWVYAQFIVVEGGGAGELEEFDGSGLLLWDTQENAVSVDDSEAKVLSIIQSNDNGTGTGWTNVKLMNGQITYLADPPHDGSIDCSSTGDAEGWVYTVDADDIAEFSGVKPGFGPYGYMFEGWAAACGGQEDYFLTWGDQTTDGEIPGDVWFQFWYFQESDTEWRHIYPHPKFIYPCRGGYGCQAAAGDYIITRNMFPQMPWFEDGGAPNNTNDHGERYINFKHGQQLGGMDVMSWNNGIGDTSTYDEIGQSLRDTPTFDIGKWQLVRIHIDTSEAAQTADDELMESWVRDYGDCEWTLTTRWEDGEPVEPVDPEMGAVTFEYNLDGATNGYGHKGFITPANTVKTTGPFGVGLEAGGNNRYVIADWAMAPGTNSGGTGVSALPDCGHYGY